MFSPEIKQYRDEYQKNTNERHSSKAKLVLVYGNELRNKKSLSRTEAYIFLLPS